jgi:hypothetical protein
VFSHMVVSQACQQSKLGTNHVENLLCVGNHASLLTRTRAKYLIFLCLDFLIFELAILHHSQDCVRIKRVKLG